MNAAHSPDFIDKDAWPPNSPDLNPLDLLPCLGLDVGQIQPSEPTTAEYPGAEDSASDDGMSCCKKLSAVNRQLPQASARLRQRRRRTL